MKYDTGTGGNFFSQLGNSRPVFQYTNLGIGDAQSHDFGIENAAGILRLQSLDSRLRLTEVGLHNGCKTIINQ